MNEIFFYFEIFCKTKSSPTRHLKHQVINFAPAIESIVVNNPSPTNFERYLTRIKSPLTRS